MKRFKNILLLYECDMGPQLFPSLVLSAFVLIGNPLIVMVIMGGMGYRKRTGFLAGLTVAQISEFSLMLGALGKNLGHITGDVLALITLVGLTTITLSTYWIMYSHLLYERLAPALSWFERRNPFREVAMETTMEPPRGFDVIVFGLGRFGNHIVRELTERGQRALGVDFDPDLVHRLRETGHAVVYGDAEVATARNALLLLMVLFENIHIGNCRSETKSALRFSPLRSPILLAGAITAFAVHLTAIYTPLGQTLLETEPVALKNWGILFLLALTIFPVMELHKWSWKMRHRESA